MATYEYDFSAFESSAARKLKMKDDSQNGNPKLVKLEAKAKVEPKAEPKTQKQRKAEKSKARIRYFRAAVVLFVLSALFMTYIYAFYKCDSIDRQISSLTNDYNMLCGQNTELEMKLNNMVSLEQIEKVAVEELGLVKINSSDIEFVRIAGENKVLVTQAKPAQ